MMTIEDEIQFLENFLSHSCGFEVSLYGTLEIRPIDEGCPPTEWEVIWFEVKDGMELECFKEFNNLHEACQCFVEKRRYLCLGADFEQVLSGGETVHVEIEE